MDLRDIKKIYFSTVCFPFPLYVLYMFIGGTFPINPSASAILKYYFIIGIILLLLDFWSNMVSKITVRMRKFGGPLCV